MKIGILTFHMAHNYGAMLQAYALRKYISDIGKECEVIDYRFEYIYKWHRNPTRVQLQREYGYFVGSLKWIRRWIYGYYSKNGKRYKFNSFMMEKMGISKTITYEELMEQTNYDLVFFGSDQIWNANLTGGVREEYFGKIGGSSVKVSYAASRGAYKFSEQQELYCSLLKNFAMIGVREDGLKRDLEKMGIQNVEVVVDPTLLLSKDSWTCLRNYSYKKNLRDYILIYDIDNRPELIDVAKQIKEKTNKNIIYIVYERKKSMKNVYQITDAGPLEFLELFQRASFIVTNSFHGTCFSIIFEKNFYVVLNNKGDTRIESLLDGLDLKARMLDGKDLVEVNETIDYNKINLLLEENVKKSKEFIDCAIAKVKND